MTTSQGQETINERALIISSDGHAVPKMRDYRNYLPARMHEAFDEFCDWYDEGRGVLVSDPRYLTARLDAEAIDDWTRKLVEPGRLDGCFDPVKRLAEMEREGIAGEVLFPDFGLAFEPPPAHLFSTERRSRTREEIEEGNRAYNRWLVDFCSVAPERLFGMAIVSFDDVEKAMAEISWAREAGLKGVVLPTFTPEWPIFHERYDPIWSLLEDIGMPANSHITFSGTVAVERYAGIPHPSVETKLHVPELRFRCQELLAHLIWGGVLERHPRLGVAFTEQGSAWVPAALDVWDSICADGFLRRDIKEVIPHRPSEYFRRQCWLGSSTFSRAEIEARDWIGLDVMLLGMDYPHHEGTFAVGTTDYLRATLGAVGVSPHEARQLLAGNAIERWGFDGESLGRLAARIGPELDLLLTPPDDINNIPRGDIGKALATSAM